MSASTAVLSAEGLKVELGGAPVLDIPSFQLYDGELVTVVGPNGSGKSTLLLTLACLLKRFSGRISYRGELLDSREAVFRFRQRISVVFQEPLLFDTSVYNNVAAGLKLRRFSRNAQKERVSRYLEMFQIGHLGERSARKLSGGESQRTSLARAFAIEPEVIFLDEPFSALDPPTRHALTHDLHKIVRATGTTTVMVTHLESEALTMSGRIVVMNGGGIAQAGSPSEVMNNPANEFVARFVGMENIFRGRVLKHADRLLVISALQREVYATGRAQPNEEVLCCIRPENVVVDTQKSAGMNGASNIFRGRVTQIYSLGPFLKLSLDCGFPLVSLVTRETFANLQLAEGKEVCASFMPASVHIIPAVANGH